MVVIHALLGVGERRDLQHHHHSPARMRNLRNPQHLPVAQHLPVIHAQLLPVVPAEAPRNAQQLRVADGRRGWTTSALQTA